MKKKNSIQKVVMRRFIAYSIRIALVIMFLQVILDIITEFTGWKFTNLDFIYLPLEKETQIMQIVMSIVWYLTVALVYVFTVIPFGRSVSLKITEPVQHLVEGFREVSTGNLDVSLEFQAEMEFDEMRIAFNDMVQRLKNSEEQRLLMEKKRMQLFSNIAHDLKTPMTTITGYAGALVSGLVEGEEKSQEYYTAIKVKSEQVNLLIDQLLSYSKLGAYEYQLNLEKTDIIELVRLACASLFREIENKEMELELKLPNQPLYCNIDMLEMNRAINNLLINAIRHNQKGSKIMVSVCLEADEILIQIADNGVKIEEELTDNLFEPFVSGDLSRKSGSGTGLGLAIVKKVMDLHGGRIVLSDADSPYTKMFTLSFL